MGEEIVELTDCRPEVQRFAVLMEKVLRRNDWKGGWKDMTPDEIIERLHQELRELERLVVTVESRYNSIQGHGYEQFVEQESADIANFAMFMVDNYGWPLDGG